MRIALRISNPDDPAKAVEVPDALVDTGAAWTSVPRALVAELGLRQVGTIRVRTAAGPQELAQSYAQFELVDKTLVTNISVSDTLTTVLIGVTTRDSLGLMVDPVKGQLIETDLLLL
ncbi:MAG: aspartyl protease [Dehalococcoidia bacterium]|nr:aspartyl protease [Dehalococcoidia bacterium]